ncbi:MAG: sulfatase-like hydrolase/transferase, partial [Planctomycetota bacterium]
PQLLQKAGYQTAYIGKWHMGPSPEPRPGYDYWLSFLGQGKYNNPELNENGRNFKAKGYMTDLLTQYAVDYLKRPRNKPFCLCLGHKAVHGPFTPAERHKDLFKNIDLPEPPNFKDTFEGKPEWIRAGIKLGEVREWRRKAKAEPVPKKLKPRRWNPRSRGKLNWYRSLAAVDESVGRVLDTLNQIGAADNTVVIFTSDNGFFHGEHQRGDKRLAYDEALRIPLLVCGPGIGRPNTTSDMMVLNIDVAPTILDLAGVKVPEVMQGRSFKPLLAGEKPKWRESFLYEYFIEPQYPGIPSILAVRTNDFKFVRYPGIEDLDELYDLKNDPYEMKNLACDSRAAGQLTSMKAELDRLVKETGYTLYKKVTPVHRPGKPVFHYNFEGEGKQIIDRTGHNYHADIGALKRINTAKGKALKCDGSAYLTVARSPLLDPSNKPWAVSVWIKPETPTGVVLAHGGSKHGYALTLLKNTVEFGIRKNGDFLSPVSFKVLDTDWVHLVGMITAERVLQIYVDGQLTGSLDSDLFVVANPNNPLEIAADSDIQVYPQQLPPFTGLIDEVMIFDGELTREQIRSLAARQPLGFDATESKPTQPYRLGQLLYQEDFDKDLGQWTVEQAEGGKALIRNGKLEIEDAQGCTIWFNQKLTAPVMIEYEATMIKADGSYDRVSDLNCFWMAVDPKNPDDIFVSSGKRGGIFRNYHPLRLYYVGCGGNDNTTTRFRRYPGGGGRPLLPGHDLRDQKYLLQPNRPIKIQLVTFGNIIQYIRDGEIIFDIRDDRPYHQGWFGLRTVRNHMTVDNFRVWRLE